MSKDSHDVSLQTEGQDFPERAVRQGEDNERLIGTAMDHYQSRNLNWLGSRAERQLVQEKLVQEMALGFDHRRQALAMVLESRLHSVREACNHILTTGKTHLRQQRLEFFGQVFFEVEQRLNGLSDEFLNDMDARFEKIEGYKSSVIRERERARMERSLDGFMQTLDCLMDDFRHIIHENIGQAPGPIEVEEQQSPSSQQRPLMERLMGNGKT